jgi:hypothetical protein
MDSSNTNFSVGEIVWGKIKGYPWWPAMITETRDDNREKKYICNFIGDNSHASLIKRDLAKFEELKNYSSTKKKDLLFAIQEAKHLYNIQKNNNNRYNNNNNNNNNSNINSNNNFNNSYHFNLNNRPKSQHTFSSRNELFNNSKNNLNKESNNKTYKFDDCDDTNLESSKYIPPIIKNNNMKLNNNKTDLRKFLGLFGMNKNFYIKNNMSIINKNLNKILIDSNKKSFNNKK